MTPLSFSMAMTPDEERWRCVTAGGAATFEATMARVATGVVLVSSLLDEIMLSSQFFFHIMPILCRLA
jgi:hypothetical protein